MMGIWKDRAPINLQTEMYTKGNGKMIKAMEKEPISSRMETSM